VAGTWQAYTKTFFEDMFDYVDRVNTMYRVLADWSFTKLQDGFIEQEGEGKRWAVYVAGSTIIPR